METIAFINNIGMPQLILILVIVLLLFGSRKLPELARSVGSSMRELRSGLKEEDNENRKQTSEKARSESSQ